MGTYLDRDIQMESSRFFGLPSPFTGDHGHTRLCCKSPGILMDPLLSKQISLLALWATEDHRWGVDGPDGH